MAAGGSGAPLIALTRHAVTSGTDRRRNNARQGGRIPEGTRRRAAGGPRSGRCGHRASVAGPANGRARSRRCRPARRPGRRHARTRGPSAVGRLRDGPYAGRVGTVRGRGARARPHRARAERRRRGGDRAGTAPPRAPARRSTAASTSPSRARCRAAGRTGQRSLRVAGPRRGGEQRVPRHAGEERRVDLLGEHYGALQQGAGVAGPDLGPPLPRRIGRPARASGEPIRSANAATAASYRAAVTSSPA